MSALMTKPSRCLPTPTAFPRSAFTPSCLHRSHMYIVCWAGSMKLLSVQLSVCLSVPSGSCHMLLWQVCCCREISIVYCTSGAQQQMQAVSHCQPNARLIMLMTILVNSSTAWRHIGSASYVSCKCGTAGLCYWPPCCCVAGRAAIHWYLLPVGPTAANPPLIAAVG